MVQWYLYVPGDANVRVNSPCDCVDEATLLPSSKVTLCEAQVEYPSPVHCGQFHVTVVPATTVRVLGLKLLLSSRLTVFPLATGPGLPPPVGLLFVFGFVPPLAPPHPTSAAMSAIPADSVVLFIVTSAKRRCQTTRRIAWSRNWFLP